MLSHWLSVAACNWMPVWICPVNSNECMASVNGRKYRAPIVAAALYLTPAPASKRRASPEKLRFIPDAEVERKKEMGRIQCVFFVRRKTEQCCFPSLPFLITLSLIFFFFYTSTPFLFAGLMLLLLFVLLLCPRVVCQGHRDTVGQASAAQLGSPCLLCLR